VSRPERALALLREGDPLVFRLAESVSLAVRAEPALVRLARHRLVPEADPGVEADLWFHPVVRQASAEGIVLEPDAGDALRHDLAGRDPKRYERTWSLTRECHRALSPALRLEEEVLYLAYSGRPEARERMRRLLASALAALVAGDRRGLAGWAARALPRFPLAVRELEEAAMLGAAADLRLDKSVVAPARSWIDEEWRPWITPSARSRVGVRLLQGVLEIASPPPEDRTYHRLSLLATDPMVLEILPGDAAETADVLRLEIRPGESRAVKVDPGPLLLKTLLGDTYRLEPEEAAVAREVLDFSGVFERHRPVYEPDFERMLSGLLGGSTPARPDYVSIPGGMGAGKTALSVHIARAFAPSGAELAPHHFFRAEVPEWADPRRAELSLVAQIERLIPVQRGRNASRSLGTALRRWSDATTDERLVVVLDATDQASSSDSLTALLPEKLPERVKVVYSTASSTTLLPGRDLSLLEPPAPTSSLLERWPAFHRWQTWQPDVLEGVARSPAAWWLPAILADGGETVPLDESVGDEDAQSLERTVGTLWAMLDDRVQTACAVVCVTREALSARLLARLVGGGDTLLQQSELAILLEHHPHDPQSGLPKSGFWIPRSDAIAQAVKETLGEEGVRRHHQVLLGSVAAWPPAPEEAGELGEDELRERRTFGLRHALHHAVGARNADKAEELMADIEYLEERLRVSSPDRLLSDVRATTDLLEERSANGIDESAALLRASVLAGILETEQERLRAGPEALSSLVHNRLVERESSPGASAFRYRGGQPPELRLHRVVRRSTGDGGEPAVRGHRGPVRGARLLVGVESDPSVGDLELIAFEVLSWGDDGAVLLWAPPSTSPRRLTARPGVPVVTCAILREAEVAAAYADGVVEIVRFGGSSRTRALQAHEQPIGGIVALGSDDGRFATFAADGMVRLWEPGDDSPLLTLHGGHSGPVAAALLLPGNRLATGAADGSVRIWDLETGEEMHRLKAHNAPATVLAFGEGPYLATAGEDATVRLWNQKTLELARELHGHDLAVTTLAFDPDGDVVSASLDRTVRRWSPESGREMERFDHPAAVTGLAFPSRLVMAADQPLVTACADGTLRACVRWSDAWRRESVLDAHPLPCRGCAVDPAGGTLASWSDDGSIALWDLETAELRMRLAEPEPPRRPLIARDRSWIAFGPQGGFEAHLDREELRELRGPVNSAEMNVVVDRTEPRVAFWYEEAVTARERILDLHPPDGQERRLLTSHTRRIGGCSAVSDDRVLTWSWDGSLQIRPLQGAAEPTVLLGHRGPILDCAISRKGRPRALSASTDASVRLWDLEAGSLLRVWEEVSPHVTALLIDEDLDRYLVGTAAGEVAVLMPEWPAAVRGSGHQGAVRGLAIQPDALSDAGFPRFYSTGDDGTLRLWNLLDPYEIEAAAVAYANAPLRSVSAIESYVAAQDVWGNLWIYHHLPNDAR